MYQMIAHITKPSTAAALACAITTKTITKKG
jgi:hypothetical protein